MKVRITGAAHWVNRMYEACGSYQWARELLKNSIESGARRVEFGIEWQAVERLGCYRRTVIDDGCGMDREELIAFFSTLGAGSKKIGGVHDNFGVGAKIATLPWNPAGLVVVSYKDGKGSMIWIALDEDSGDYELVEFETESGSKTCVVQPMADEEVGIDWGALRPDWMGEHGTIVVMLGSASAPDTVLGDPRGGEGDIKGLSVYLNWRFFELNGLDVRVSELRSDKKNQWPESPQDKDNRRRPNNRKIEGARHYIRDVKSKEDKGRLAAMGEVLLDEGRVKAEWYLWEGDRPAIHSYAKKSGYIAIKYKGELFELTAHKADFRRFGVTEAKVQQNLWIILEPQLLVDGGPRWGIHPDQSRNRLNFTGHGIRGGALPLADWGYDFVDNLPDEIRQAIHAARGDTAGSIQDEEYRKRLQEKFGSRWVTKRFVIPHTPPAPDDSVPANPLASEVDVSSDLLDPPPRRKKPKPVNPSPRRRRRVMRMRGAAPAAAGDERAVEVDAAVDVPRYRLAPADNFQRPFHLAMWSPNEEDGPTVFINRDSPILDDVIKYHQARYTDAISDEVRQTVLQVFGEVAVARIAHSQKLTKEIAEQDLDNEYRSEQALTISLMGLLAEDAVISQRLGRLGPKRRAEKAAE